MVWLAIDTLILMTVAVAVGALVGALARQWFGRRKEASSRGATAGVAETATGAKPGEVAASGSEPAGTDGSG